MEEGCRMWQWVLVSKFLSRLVSLEKVQQNLTPRWTLQYECEIFPMTNGFFIFRFNSSDYRDKVLLH